MTGEDRALFSTPIMQQALVVVLDAAVSAAALGRRLQKQTVFDALASRWAEPYIHALNSGPARVSWQMLHTTAQPAWRSLRLKGLKFGALYRAARNGYGLLTTEDRRGGRHVTVHYDSPVWSEFDQIMKEDGQYDRSRKRSRLMLADDDRGIDQVLQVLPVEWDEEDADDFGYGTQKVAAEWADCTVEPGAESLRLIGAAEEAVLYLNVSAFNAEVAAADAELEQLRCRKDLPMREYHKMLAQAEGDVTALKAIQAQLKDAKVDNYGDIAIQSRFYQTLNRRIQAANFWLTEVSGKHVHVFAASHPDAVPVEKILYEPISADRPPTIVSDAASDPGLRLVRVLVYEADDNFFGETSRRGRLFSVDASRLNPRLDPWGNDLATVGGGRIPVVGADISSSQLWVLALFTGDGGLERLLESGKFKEIAARRLWERHSDRLSGFSGPDDPMLQACCKLAPMTHLYGSTIPKIAERLGMQQQDYGPGLDRATIALLLDDDELHLKSILEEFLPACRRIAWVAYQRDPYRGVVLTNPLDLMPVRWNHIRTELRRIAGDSTNKIYGQVPVVKVKGKMRPATPNGDGEYEVNPYKLQQVVAPCVTHMMDTLFNAKVVDGLKARGVGNIVPVHDAWYVPADAEPALYEAVDAAGRSWFEALGPVYEAFSGYLEGDTRFGAWVRKICAKWEGRKAEAQADASRWPRFKSDSALIVRELKKVGT
jgi:hypothetical protein